MKLWTPQERLNYIYAFMQFDMKNMELDFWQDEFIRSRKQYICVLKSRRTGYSFATALKGLVKAMDPARTKYTKQFVSYNESDAVEKIRYALEFYESMPVQYKKKIVHKNATTLEFLDAGGKTTSRLISLPCRPPRGKGGDISLDEYAIYLPKVSNQIYTAALYCIMRGGCIEVGSTPLGTIGKFYDICTRPQDFPDYERYDIPWWFAHALCVDVEAAIVNASSMTTEERVYTYGTEILKAIFRNSTLEDFQQECECTFVDSASSYISLELIYANTPGKREEDIPTGIVSDDEYFETDRNLDITVYKTEDEAILNYDEEKHGSPLYLGYDVSRNIDAIAFYIIGIVDGKKRSFMRIEVFGMSFEDQKDIFRKLMKNLPIFRACVDMTGMGLPICEQLKEEFGERVEGVDFNVQSKETLAMGVKFGLERKEFLLENDRDFHSQIHSIKRTPSVGGSFRYDAERTDKGHADGFWAWALANFAYSGVDAPASFYEEYARKKNASVLELSNNQEEASGKTTTRLTRGKPLNTVLRGLNNVQR